jgi:hypothetical protein
MPKLRRLKPLSTLEYIASRKRRLTCASAPPGMPDGVRRDELVREAGQMDIAIDSDGLLSNPGVFVPA